MSVGVNKVLIIGNLGRDPEVRYTQSGSAVCNLRVAVGERRKDGDGWRDHTEWITVVCFGRTAENVGQYLSKGRQIYCEGRLQTRSYTAKDGTEKWSTEVIANQVLFLGGRDGGGGPSGPGGGGGGGSGGGGADTSSGGGDDSFYDDDLPF